MAYDSLLTVLRGVTGEERASMTAVASVQGEGGPERHCCLMLAFDLETVVWQAPIEVFGPRSLPHLVLEAAAGEQVMGWRTEKMAGLPV